MLLKNNTTIFERNYDEDLSTQHKKTAENFQRLNQILVHISLHIFCETSLDIFPLSESYVQRELSVPEFLPTIRQKSLSGI